MKTCENTIEETERQISVLLEEKDWIKEETSYNKNINGNHFFIEMHGEASFRKDSLMLVISFNNVLDDEPIYIFDGAVSSIAEFHFLMNTLEYLKEEFN